MAWFWFLGCLALGGLVAYLYLTLSECKAELKTCKRNLRVGKTTVIKAGNERDAAMSDKQLADYDIGELQKQNTRLRRERDMARKQAKEWEANCHEYLSGTRLAPKLEYDDS